MSLPTSWFRLPFMYRPRAERRESPALVAVHWDGRTPRQHSVANLSSSGAYLLTHEQWTPGEIVSLTLQRKGALENTNRDRFTVQAKAVRRDKGGVAVTYLLPNETNVRLWQPTLKSDEPQTEPEDVVREFRTATAIAFISRIAPQAAERAAWLMRRGLSTHRLESALEIVLHAEEMLALAPGVNRFKVHPDLVLRMLEDGSWAELDWIQHYWSGLLISCCTTGQNPVADDFELPALLSQLTTVQARIFATACDTAVKQMDPYGKVCADSLLRSADELAIISGVHDRAHIERDIQHLSWLGILEETVKWKFFALIEEANITPTPLALKLYARCHAHRGDLASFYGIQPAMALSFSAD